MATSIHTCTPARPACWCNTGCTNPTLLQLKCEKTTVNRAGANRAAPWANCADTAHALYQMVDCLGVTGLMQKSQHTNTKAQQQQSIIHAVSQEYLQLHTLHKLPCRVRSYLP